MDGNGTFRTVYTVQFDDFVYVLHAFQKKSKSGIKTPITDINLVKQRLKAAEKQHEERLKPKISALIRRKLDGFSVERLINFLNKLGQDVDIIVRPKPKSRKKAVINVFHESSSSTCRNMPMAAKSC